MRKLLLPVVAAGLTACAGAGGNSTKAADTKQVLEQPEVALECRTQPGSQAVAERKSPYDSVKIDVGGRIAQICYGRPSARSRVIFAEPAEPMPLVPFGKLWRTGANEPTIVHLPFAAKIAGLAVEPGSYSIYTVPGAAEWTVIVNRSVSQWGHESQYTAEVQAQEVGRAQVKPERMEQAVEMFTIRSEPTTAGADVVLEWERTRVRIPIQATS